VRTPLKDLLYSYTSRTQGPSNLTASLDDEGENDRYHDTT
jgi:hypothetical protein